MCDKVILFLNIKLTYLPTNIDTPKEKKIIYHILILNFQQNKKSIVHILEYLQSSNS